MSKKLAHLEPVDLREIWGNEAGDFTPWLAENLNLLAERLGMEFELEAQEINVGDFRADILCRNMMDDSLVLIENQLEVSDHRHLGQIMTYAAGLEAHTIIWIAGEFKEEHLAALDWQNEITDERFQYFGIEIKAWQIENSGPAPKFDIVSSPNTWSRQASRETERAVSESPSPTKQHQLKFWTQLRKYMSQEKSHLPSLKPYENSSLYFWIGYACWIGVSHRRPNKDIGVSIYIEKKNQAYFNVLKENRNEIENEFNEFEGQLEWSEPSETSRNNVR